MTGRKHRSLYDDLHIYKCHKFNILQKLSLVGCVDGYLQDCHCEERGWLSFEEIQCATEAISSCLAGLRDLFLNSASNKRLLLLKRICSLGPGLRRTNIVSESDYLCIFCVSSVYYL
jgi:hypothetical protein